MKSMRFDKNIFLIGLGFLTVTVAWAVYNAFVPIFLDRLIDNTVFIGFVMTFDNITGALLQPFFGDWSDRTHTRFGRRMPFLLVGIPLSAVALALIPLHANILTLMGAIIVMNFGMSIYRAPVVAMMPDCTPETKRSKANGIINLMGGVGTLLAFLAGGMLFDIHEGLPFFASGAIMLAAVFLVAFFYKEPPAGLYGKAEETLDGEEKAGQGAVGKRYELIMMLITVFFLFCGYNAIETYLSLYSTYVLDISPGNAAFIFALLAGSFLVSTVPAGMIGEKIGHLKSMLVGSFVIALSLFVIVLYPSVRVVSSLMFVNGVAWALVVINAYPFIISLAPNDKVGKYTGYYYFFSFFASIVSPLLFGAIVDWVKDYKVLFLYSCVMFLIAFSFLLVLSFKKRTAEPE